MPYPFEKTPLTLKKEYLEITRVWIAHGLVVYGQISDSSAECQVSIWPRPFFRISAELTTDYIVVVVGVTQEPTICTPINIKLLPSSCTASCVIQTPQPYVPNRPTKGIIFFVQCSMLLFWIIIIQHHYVCCQAAAKAKLFLTSVSYLG